MNGIKEIEEAVKDVESKVQSAFQRYEGELKEHGSVSAKTRDELKALSEDFAILAKERDAMATRLRDLEQMVASGAKGHGQKPKSIGASIVSSDEFKNALRPGGAGLRGRVSMNIQANTIIGEGGSPQDPVNTIVAEDRLAGIFGGAFRQLNVLDFVPRGQTSSNQVQYTRELAWTNDAAETRENSTKPESDLTFSLIDEPVRTVAHWIRASKQVLDDAPALEAYINIRMLHGARQRLQGQILVGNGTSPNIEGMSSTNKSTAFTPSTGENQFDSLNRAKYAIVGQDHVADFVILNPADFGAMERLKISASDDRYLVAAANNAMGYLNNGMTPTIWGLPVVLSNSITSGKFLMGDSRQMMLFMRQDATVEMFEQDGDNVRNNLITIRAELRAALASFAPLAFRYGSLVQA